MQDSHLGNKISLLVFSMSNRHSILDFHSLACYILSLKIVVNLPTLPKFFLFYVFYIHMLAEIAPSKLFLLLRNQCVLLCRLCILTSVKSSRTSSNFLMAAQVTIKQEPAALTLEDR